MTFKEIISHRYWFAAVYASIAITTGWLNGLTIDGTGLNAFQLAIMGTLGSLAGGGFLAMLLAGNFDLRIALVLLACGVGPLVLIYLAFIRGRRIDRRFLVTFPVLSAAVALIGSLPFSSLDSGTATWGPSVFAWILDGACLYHGAWREAEQDER